MLFTTAGAAQYVSGVILFDETIRQTASDGRPLAKILEADGVIPGIKVDKGAVQLAKSPDEKVTDGLDGLRERLVEYRGLGARFAKWRAVITIGEHIPSRLCIDLNAHALARYAALCQDEGIVPIVEPEVLMDGDHSLERCYTVTSDTLHGRLRRALRAAGRPRRHVVEAEHGDPGQGSRELSRCRPRWSPTRRSRASGGPFPRRCRASCSSPAARTTWKRPRT